MAQPAFDGIAEMTADARLLRISCDAEAADAAGRWRRWDDVVAAAAALADGIAPFDLPALAVADVHGFLALRETAPCPALQALADLARRVARSVARAARRRTSSIAAAGAGLTAAQEAMLRRWGYPYVFGTWFFHMTLIATAGASRARELWRARAAAHFAPSLARPRRVGAVALFTQASVGAPFLLAQRLPLRG